MADLVRVGHSALLNTKAFGAAAAARPRRSGARHLIAVARGGRASFAPTPRVLSPPPPGAYRWADAMALFERATAPSSDVSFCGLLTESRAASLFFFAPPPPAANASSRAAACSVVRSLKASSTEGLNALKVVSGRGAAPRPGEKGAHGARGIWLFHTRGSGGSQLPSEHGPFSNTSRLRSAVASPSR